MSMLYLPLHLLQEGAESRLSASSYMDKSLAIVPELAIMALSCLHRCLQLHLVKDPRSHLPITLELPLLEVFDWQGHRLFPVLQPLQYLAAQASSLTLLTQLVTSAEEVAACGSVALKTLRASHSDRPVDRERHGLVLVVVERRQWAHEAGDNACDRVVREDAATEIGRIEATGRSLNRAGDISGVVLIFDLDLARKSVGTDADKMSQRFLTFVWSLPAGVAAEGEDDALLELDWWAIFGVAESWLAVLEEELESAEKRTL
jgi:hypothetical protein